MTITTLQVGAPYPGALPPSDGIYAEFFRHGSNRLLVAMSGISPSEAQDYRTGRAKAGLAMVDGLIVLLWRFGSQPWTDSPFDAAVIPPDERTIPDLDAPEQRLAIEIHIVDRTTRLVRGLRLLSLSPALSAKLIEAAKGQAAPVDAATYQKFYARPTSEWVERALVRTWCG